MTNPLQVPELLQLILSAVDTKSLHSCACVSHLWFRHAATTAQNRLQTNQQVLFPSPPPLVLCSLSSSSSLNPKFSCG